MPRAPSRRMPLLPLPPALAFLLPAKGERFLKSSGLPWGELAMTVAVFTLIAGLINKIGEFLKEIFSIVRSRRRFRVILDAENGHFGVS